MSEKKEIIAKFWYEETLKLILFLKVEIVQ